MPKGKKPKQKNKLNTTRAQNTSRGERRARKPGIIDKIVRRDTTVSSTSTKEDNRTQSGQGLKSFFRGGTPDDEPARQRRLTGNMKLKNSGPKPKKLKDVIFPK